MGMLRPDNNFGKFKKVIKLAAKLLGLNKPLEDWRPSLLPPARAVGVMVLGTKEDIINWEPKMDPNQLLKDGYTPQENL